MNEIAKKLLDIQSELKVPKAQFNDFGKYQYRSCEDIVEAAKPILMQHKVLLTISDKIIEVGGRVYVEATSTLTDIESGETISITAAAREAVTKKGMDDSQITGSTSSYARKYSLNGLFAIDDTKDADTMRPEKKEAVGNVKEEFPSSKEIKGDEALILTIKSYEHEDDLKGWKKDHEKEIDASENKGEVMGEYFKRLKEIKK